jgi:soluble lytic murein transglycosylase-like protein
MRSLSTAVPRLALFFAVGALAQVARGDDPAPVTDQPDAVGPQAANSDAEPEGEEVESGTNAADGAFEEVVAVSGGGSAARLRERAAVLEPALRSEPCAASRWALLSGADSAARAWASRAAGPKAPTRCGRAGCDLEIAASEAGPCALSELRDWAHLVGRLCALDAEVDCALGALRLAVALQRPTRGPIEDVARLDLARALDDRGTPDDLAEAVEVLHGVSANPLASVRPDAARLEGEVLARLGRHPEARAVWGGMLSRWPSSPLSEVVRVALDALPEEGPPALSTSSASRRRTEGAADVASLALAGGAPPPPAARTRRADLETIDGLISERRHAEARVLLEPWLALADSDDPDERRAGLDALDRSANLAWEEHRFADALAAHARLRDHGRRDGLPRHRQARALAYEGRFDAALRLLRRDEAIDLLFEFGRCAEAVRLSGEKPRGRARRPRGRSGASPAGASATSTASDAAVGVELSPAELEQDGASGRRRGGRRSQKPKDERTALCLLQLGRHREAASFWAERGRGRARGESLKDRYWYARTKAAAGQRDEARRLFGQIVEDDPVDYYGHLAWSRLRELSGEELPESARHPTKVTHRAVDPSAWRPSIAWSEASLHGAFDCARAPAEPAALEGTLAAFAELQGGIAPEAHRALAFARLGDLHGAAEELRVIDADVRAAKRGARSVAERARSDLLDNRSVPKARGGLSMKEPARRSLAEAKAFTSATGGLRPELRVAQVALADPFGLRRHVYETESTGRLERLPPQMAEAAHPIAYPEVVGPISRQFGLPPYYVYAIMLTESSFHPGAVSVANAWGLVQVIPPTGRHLARELGFGTFSPELLLDPALSVYFGGYYLGRLLNRFRGQELLAAAGYNAGPHRVTQWLLARGHLPQDVFVELIPYQQAHRYAKRVVQHIGSYRRIYHGEPHTYVRNTLVTDLGEGPNY